MLSAPDHSDPDIVSLRRSKPRGAEVRYLVLIDRLVRCDVHVHVVRAGSLDPLASRILDALGSVKTLELSDLCHRLHMMTSAERRIVAEAVYALERAGACIVHDTTIRGHEQLWEPAQLATFRDDVLFLPAASVRYSPESGSRESLSTSGLTDYRKRHRDVPQREPGWHELYTHERLQEEVGRSYSLRLPPRHNEVFGDVNQHHVLQRARMQVHRLRFVAATVVTPPFPVRYILHRIYMYRRNPSDNDPDTLVGIKLYNVRRPASHYTRFVRGEFEMSPALRQEFWEAGKVLS